MTTSSTSSATLRRSSEEATRALADASGANGVAFGHVNDDSQGAPVLEPLQPDRRADESAPPVTPTPSGYAPPTSSWP